MPSITPRNVPAAGSPISQSHLRELAGIRKNSLVPVATGDSILVSHNAHARPDAAPQSYELRAHAQAGRRLAISARLLSHAIRQAKLAHARVRSQSRAEKPIDALIRATSKRAEAEVAYLLLAHARDLGEFRALDQINGLKPGTLLYAKRERHAKAILKSTPTAAAVDASKQREAYIFAKKIETGYLELAQARAASGS